MEYIYSAMVLHSAGKEITDEGLTKILKAAGIKADKTRVKALTASLDGVNIDEAISTAMAAPVAAQAPVSAQAEAAGERPEEAKPEEEEEEEEATEEEAAAGLGALFG